MKLYHLQVNHLTNPLGFRMNRTSFSWKVSEAKGKQQIAARICIAKTEEALKNKSELLVDTGYDKNADSLAYSVKFDLEPYTRYFWNVSVKTDAGEEETSETAWFETSKMEEAWMGTWITCDSTIRRHPVFTKDIAPKKEVESARLYICGVGLYEAYFTPKNGGKAIMTPTYEDKKYRIGEEYLTPYSNDYEEWLQYQTFDVTEQMKTEGTLAVILGNGWFKARFGFSAFDDTGYYGNEWKLIAEVRIRYTDGSEEIIGTDDSWNVHRSNIIFSNLYDGEQVDDTLSPAEEGPAALCEAPRGVLTPRMSLPVLIHEKLEPVELITTPAGECVFDFGQEIAGLFLLKVNEPKGTKLHIQTGEVLQNGNFYNENLRTAKSEFIYISDGTAKTIIPHFTYYGYRYVKVSGISNLKKQDITALALYSDIAMTGNLTTGHELVNQLISNVRWGMKDNFIDVPTDCPQRDERMGWTGDTQVFSPTATYLSDTFAFYAKYLFDMAQEQKNKNGKVPDVIPSCGVESTACVWGDASCIIPWNLYHFYGDKAILEDQFESMRSWVDYIAFVDGDGHNWGKQFHYGDWLALDNPNQKVDTVLGGTDEEFIANVYYAASAGITADAAKILGKEEEEKKYRTLSDQIVEYVKYEYYSPSGRCCIKTQTAMLLTLKYHLSDNEELIRSVLEKLFSDNSSKLKTGFVGTPLLGNVLTENGLTELAFHLLLNEEYPGWLHEILLGATTVWERWNSVADDGSISSTGMNSLNHYAYGSIVEWMYRHVLGIDQDANEIGFKKAVLHPQLNWELRKVKGDYDSPAGRYQLDWELTDPRHVTIHVTVPFGCEATISFPESNWAEEHLYAGSYEYSYELLRSLKKEYTLDTPIWELFENKKVADEISGIISYENIPAQYHEKSLNEMFQMYQGRMTPEDLLTVEEKLKKF